MGDLKGLYMAETGPKMAWPGLGRKWVCWCHEGRKCEYNRVRQVVTITRGPPRIRERASLGICEYRPRAGLREKDSSGGRRPGLNYEYKKCRVIKLNIVGAEKYPGCRTHTI